MLTLDEQLLTSSTFTGQVSETLTQLQDKVLHQPADCLGFPHQRPPPTRALSGFFRRRISEIFAKVRRKSQIKSLTK